MEKYRDLLELGNTLGLRYDGVEEKDGKLYVKAGSTYQLEKDLFWDKIKSYPDGEREVAADISVEKTDIHGIHTVKSGDTLSKIAKLHLDDPKRYPEIFEANRDILDNPDVIKPGQKLKIPNR
jgi:LysM repeat protein